MKKKVPKKIRKLFREIIINLILIAIAIAMYFLSKELFWAAMVFFLVYAAENIQSILKIASFDLIETRAEVAAFLLVFTTNEFGLGYGFLMYILVTVARALHVDINDEGDIVRHLIMHPLVIICAAIISLPYLAEVAVCALISRGIYFAVNLRFGLGHTLEDTRLVIGSAFYLVIIAYTLL